jgi:hypothetical protein
MKKFISFLLIMALCLTSISAVNASASAKKYNKNLTGGEYVVGEDIPVGKYDVKAIVGCGTIKIYKSLSDYDKEKSTIKFICLGTKEEIKNVESMYGTSYKNLRLKKGYCMVISVSLTTNFKSK